MSAFSNALSGLKSAITRLHVNADNVARKNVPNSEKNRVIDKDVATGGVTSEVQKVPLDPALKTDGTDAGDLNSSNIDYAEEAVSRIVSTVTYKANATVVKTADEMQKGLLNIKA